MGMSDAVTSVAVARASHNLRSHNVVESLSFLSAPHLCLHLRLSATTLGYYYVLRTVIRINAEESRSAALSGTYGSNARC